MGAEAAPEPFHLLPEEGLVANVRHDDLRGAGMERAGGGAGTTMVAMRIIKPSDTPDKINYDLLTNRTRLVFHTAWEVANRDKAIVADKAQ